MAKKYVEIKLNDDELSIILDAFLTLLQRYKEIGLRGKIIFDVNRLIDKISVTLESHME